MDSDAELTRLAWSCRRGMRELDLLMSRYLERRYEDASTDERAAFRRLLDLPDPDLVALLLGKTSAADPMTARVVDNISATD